MIDWKARKSDWSGISAKVGQFESAEGGQFGKSMQSQSQYNPKLQ